MKSLRYLSYPWKKTPPWNIFVPALILSPDPDASDFLLSFISSVIQPGPAKDTEFVLKEDHPDFPGTGLKKTSVVKMNKLLTVHSALIKKRLGKASPFIQNELDKRLRIATGL